MIEIFWITDQLAVSGAFLDENIYFLREQGIEAVVDLRSEHCDNVKLIEELCIQFLHVEIDDRYSPTPEQLEEIFHFVDPLLDSHKKVLIHCQNGCGRAPLVAAALLAKRGMAVADAVSLVEDKNPTTGFTPQQDKFIYYELGELLK